MLNILFLLILLCFNIFCVYNIFILNKQLSNEQKGQLASVPMSLQIIRGVLIFAGFAICMYTFSGGFMLAVLALPVMIRIIRLGIVYKQIKNLNFPRTYFQDNVMYSAGAILTYIGIIQLMLSIMFSNFISKISSPEKMSVTISSKSTQRPLPTSSQPADPCTNVAMSIYKFTHSLKTNTDGSQPWQDVEWLKNNIGTPQQTTDTEYTNSWGNYELIYSKNNPQVIEIGNKPDALKSYPSVNINIASQALGQPQRVDVSNITIYTWSCPASDSIIKVEDENDGKSMTRTYSGKYCVNGDCDIYLYQKTLS